MAKFLLEFDLFEAMSNKQFKTKSLLLFYPVNRVGYIIDSL